MLSLGFLIECLYFMVLWFYYILYITQKTLITCWLADLVNKKINNELNICCFGVLKTPTPFQWLHTTVSV